MFRHNFANCRRFMPRKGGNPVAIVASTLGFIGLGIFGSYLYVHKTDFQKRVKIKNKYQRVTGNKDSTGHVFMVSDVDNTQFTIRKSVWRWQMLCAELWNSLEEGKEYMIRGYGWRVGWLSLYPNIYKAEMIEEKQVDEEL